MPNPGAFHGSRKAFLLGEKDYFAKGVKTGASGEALAVIQRRYFKRYPIDLPHKEEPSPEHLAGVDDDAPDPDIKQPDATKMGPAEFVEAMTRLTERRKMIKQRKAQIKRWLIYQYMKDHDSDPRDRRASSPYQAYLAKIRGQDQERPRRKSACNVWRKLHRIKIESKAKEIQAAAGQTVPKSKQAAFRDKIAREIFAALPEEERKEWAVTAETEHEEALREWQEERDKGPSTTPEDRQRAIQGLVRFVQPVLDVIAESTGWQVSLFAGGPEPAMQGMLNVISVHSGTTSGEIKLTFGQAERPAIKQEFIPTFGRYLRKCYTIEECRSRALAEEEGYVPLSEMELEGSTGLIHRLPDFPTSSSPGPSAPSTLTAPTSAPAPAALPPVQAGPPLATTLVTPNTTPIVSVAITVPCETVPGVPVPPASPPKEHTPSDVLEEVDIILDTPFPLDYGALLNSRTSSPQPSRQGSPIPSLPPSPIQRSGAAAAHSPPPSPTLSKVACPPTLMSITPTVSAAPITSPTTPVVSGSPTGPIVSVSASTPALSTLAAIPITSPAASAIPVSSTKKKTRKQKGNGVSISPAAPVVSTSPTPAAPGIAISSIVSASTSPVAPAPPGKSVSSTRKKVQRQKENGSTIQEGRLDPSMVLEDQRPRRSIKKTAKAISIEEEMTKKTARGKKCPAGVLGDRTSVDEPPAKRMRGSSKRDGGRA